VYQIRPNPIIGDVCVERKKEGGSIRFDTGSDRLLCMKCSTLLLCFLLLPCRAFSQAAPAAPAQELPHGVVHREAYASRFVKGLKDGQGTFVVYTPPGYDPSKKPGYPVLYLLHGWGGGADAWTKTGRADAMYERLLADGKAKPMVIVMPLGYGDMSFLSNGFEVWRDHEQISNNVNLFTKALLEEMMPLVQKNYDVATDREHRAIAGLSMGGLEAVTIGLTHPEVFASVGGFSSAMYPVTGADLTRLDPKKENLKLFWMACGTDDELLTINRLFEMHMREAGMPVTVVETPGKHAWPVWRNNFKTFVPLLFQDDAAKN
jgi:enterochelin esterase-like enzyme